MSGLGIQYPPPREDVPIFDPLLFLVIDEGPLTEAIADTKYLRFPFAQGTETMADMNVTGTATFFDALTHTGANGENVTTNQNIILNGTVGKYIQFPDGSQQTTASGGLPPSGVTAGAYTNTNLTVSSTGIITLASNGTAGLPATPTITAGTTNFTANGAVTYNQYGQLTSATSGVIPSFLGGSFTNPSLTVNTYGQITAISNGPGTLIQAPTYIPSSFTTDISGLVPLPPLGTRYMKIVQISGGGECIPPYYLDETTVVLGSSGGGGAYTSFEIDVRAWASFTSPMIRYENTAVTPVTNTKAPRLIWTDFACNRYNDGYFSTSIASLNQLSGGLTSLPFSSQVAYYYAPANWNYYYSYLMETTNAYYINGQSWDVGRFKVPSTNMFGQFVASNGGGGFYGGEVQTIDASGTSIGGSNPNADGAFDADIIAPWARGQTQTFTPSPTAPIGVTNATQGQGGWAFYFYG